MSGRLKSGIFLTALLISSLADNSWSQDNWQWVHPTPQGNFLRDIWAFDANTAIAVGATGTVIKTTDGGITWDIDHYVCGTNLYFESIFFVNRTTGFIVGGWFPDGGDPGAIICRTDDGGETWQQQFSGRRPILYDVYFIDENRGFAVGDKGVLSTTDGGNNWMGPIIFSPFTTSRSVFFLDEKNGFIGNDGGIIYRTTDGGANWVALTGVAIDPPVKLYKFVFVDAQIGFAVGEDGILFKTQDSGASWEVGCIGPPESASSPPCDNRSRYGDIFFMDAQTGFAVFDRNGFYRTRDAGKTWQLLSNEPQFGAALAFGDPQNAFVVGGLERSGPAGGAIYHTDDAGLNWNLRSNRLFQGAAGTGDVLFFNKNRGIVYGGLVLKTLDSGMTWQMWSDPPFQLSDVSIISQDTLFACSWHGYFMQSFDGARTWDAHNLRQDDHNQYRGISFVDSEKGWLAGVDSLGRGVILNTNDGGVTWRSQEIGVTSGLDHIRFADSQFGIAVGSNGNVLITEDNGETWALKVGFQTNIRALYVINREIAYVAGGYTGVPFIARTLDGARTWQVSEVPSNHPLNDIFFIDEKYGIAVGSRGTIIRTIDGGDTWFAEVSGTSSHLVGATMIDKNTALAIGLYGAILRNSTPDMQTSVAVNQRQNIPTTFAIHQNYPNPFNPSTTIQYEMPYAAVVNIAVFDLLGRKVVTLVQDLEQAGRGTIVWDGRNETGQAMASGLYLVRMVAGDYSSSRKILLIQ